MINNLGNLWKKRRDNFFESETFKHELSCIEKNLEEAITNAADEDIISNIIEFEYKCQIEDFFNRDVFNYINKYFEKNHGIELTRANNFYSIHYTLRFILKNDF
jgi:hypothetical protein